MFIGNLVKLRNDVTRYGNAKWFVEKAIKEDWIWLVTSMDDEDVDYFIQPLYLEPECNNFIQLGRELLVVSDEIEEIELTREDLFRALRNQVNVE